MSIGIGGEELRCMQGISHALVCAQGTARIQVAIANSARCPKKKEMRGDCAGGALASGSSKFPAEGFGIKRAAPPPKSFQKAPQNPQN